MITTVSLVNICHHTWLRKMFFLVMRIFKTYSLSYFQICNTILLIIVTVLYVISPPGLFKIYLLYLFI